MICPCGLNFLYQDCCGRYIEQKQYAPTPGALMRSRYTAFVMGKIDYIQATMRKDALKNFDATQTSDWLKEVCWQKLIVLKERLKTTRQGFVTFEAHYLFRNQPQILCEKSEFHKIGEQWFYVGGRFLLPQRSPN